MSDKKDEEVKDQEEEFEEPDKPTTSVACCKPAPEETEEE